jgi:hypothetical protein
MKALPADPYDVDTDEDDKPGKTISSKFNVLFQK